MRLRRKTLRTAPVGGRKPGGGAPAAGAPAAGGGRRTGAAVTCGRGIIMPGVGPPTPRAGPARPCGHAQHRVVACRSHGQQNHWEQKVGEQKISNSHAKLNIG